MKGIDHIFCASQASTAICLSMQQDEASSSSTIHLGGRAIDRHNPIIRDGRRLAKALPSAPCSSEPPPINPKPYHQLPKPNNNKKSSSSSSKKSSSDKKKKSSSNSKPLAEQTNKILSSTNNDATIYKDCYTAMPADIKKKSCAQLGDFITPPGSSRYLLSDAGFIDGLSDYDPVLALVPETGPEKTSTLINEDDSSAAKSPSSSSRSEKPPSNQVVVLRVSLHCKGCEGKVRKHLSRMKGVSSFNIDFAAKKVTVVGDVTPLSVLASISKVKNAQFWPAAAAATSPASAPAAFPVVVESEPIFRRRK
ncbi:protein sodium potassium root defective 1 [Citrus sinensis]|uniref:protein SODIUM POTASSIUM ROOT DEFECTIVE 3 isoform X2 n=1 Tax=Citrus sinensis TaxID=2711 RepID=UPI00219BAE77|nr:protein SODIUM POTASSIUM ROOT DEFECTIVE 3 isoform X2 [Citrus sinensis]KAH9672096.1 protein sodium potassium root defective 1 [Citrus sinensis]